MSAFSLNPEFDENTVLLKFLLPHYESTSTELAQLHTEIGNYRKLVELLNLEGRIQKLLPHNASQPSSNDFPNFNEQAYLEANADVREAVNKGLVTSGWDHFQQFGYLEHRLRDIRHLDEQHYLKAHNDVREAVQKGILPNARTHFLGSGLFEKRFFTPLQFDSAKYLSFYPEIEPLLTQQKLSALDHFSLIGFMTGRLYFVTDGS